MTAEALVEVAPGVFVATSRVMSTTSTVVVDAGQALLIDPAWMPDELEALASELRGRELEVIGGFATHAHHDHLLWHPDFGDAPRWRPTEPRRSRSTNATLSSQRSDRSSLSPWSI